MTSGRRYSLAVRTNGPRNLRRAVVGALALALLAGVGVTSAGPTSATGPGESAKAAVAPLSFRIGSFNILGSWHTRAGNGVSYEAPGPMRAHLAAEAIRLYAPGVVGFQEAEPDQVPIMAAELPDYDFWPGLELDWEGVRNNIAYDNRRFTRTAQGTIPITFLGQRRQLPFIRLQDRATGRQFWVMNAHNTPKRGSDSWGFEERKAQLDAEITQLGKMQATGLPVFFVGDLNDRIYTYCQIVRRTTLRAPQGYYPPPNDCDLPPNTHIDWIFGSASQVAWSDYKYDRGALVAQVTDHHVTWATATLP